MILICIPSSILKLQKKKLVFHRNFENWILTGVFTLLHTELHHIYYGKSSFRLSPSTLAVILLQFRAVGLGAKGGGQGGQSPPPDFGWNRGKPVPLNPFIYLIAPQIFRRSYNPTVASDHDCALKCLRVPYWFHRSLESSWDKLHFGELEEFLKVFSLMICEASTKKAIPWIDDWLLKSA